MTIEEAIAHCEDIVNDENLINCDDCKADHKQLAEWLKELGILREKQIPKKLTHLTECANEGYYCPSCGKRLFKKEITNKHKCCYNCGQRIDYSECVEC